MDWNIEFEATYRCNTTCKYCNRLVGVIDLGKDSDLTPDQVRYACRMLKEMRFYPIRVKISGGEPELNPHIKEIAEIIKISFRRSIKHLWILMNGIEDKPEVVGLEERINPLPKKNHDPFLVSPVDAGLEHHQVIHACLNRSQTGPAFDCHGFTFCALAPILGRLLRINPYKPYPVFDQDYRICRHCPLSMGRKGREEIFEWAKQGNYPSKTYRDGLQAYQDEPFEIPRLEVQEDENGEFEALIEPVEDESPDGYRVVL